MDNLNRKQRRGLAKKLRKKDPVGQATTGVIEKVGELESYLATLGSLEQSLSDNVEMIKSLAEDIQSLEAELAVQRETNLRLLSRLYANAEYPEQQALKQLRELESSVRNSLLEELTAEVSGEVEE